MSASTPSSAGIPSTERVAIIGAGAMGAGIAQVAATHGWNVSLVDVDIERSRAAVDGIGKRLARLVEKKRIDQDKCESIAARLSPVAFDSLGSATDITLVIEAIVEDFDVKCAVLGSLARSLPDDTILATNTSSLSVTEIGRGIDAESRTIGMHFFNPAPLLKLVEVIPSARTDDVVTTRVRSIAESWGKVVAVARDLPGFIVNHCARPYYLEAFRILGDGHADAATIDGVMRDIGGFRMGPLELTDLIGQDVNTATTRQVWEKLGEPPLLAPSDVQESLVAAGKLGRKTGAGVYDHSQPSASPRDLGISMTQVVLSDHDRAAIRAAAEAAIDPARKDGVGEIDDDATLILTRILIALIEQARRAVALGVASEEDVDTALRFGTNYPLGPFAWAARVGDERIEAARNALLKLPGGSRFASPVSV